MGEDVLVASGEAGVGADGIIQAGIGGFGGDLGVGGSVEHDACVCEVVHCACDGGDERDGGAEARGGGVLAAGGGWGVGVCADLFWGAGGCVGGVVAGVGVADAAWGGVVGDVSGFVGWLRAVAVVFCAVAVGRGVADGGAGGGVVWDVEPGDELCAVWGADDRDCAVGGLDGGCGEDVLLDEGSDGGGVGFGFRVSGFGEARAG